MKLITRNTDYAIRALCFIASRKNGIISVSELVRKLKIPKPFLRKILQVLNRKKILKSYKGKGGGFELALPPGKIFLINLIKIFQGSLKLNECIFKTRLCPDIKRCPLKRKIDIIEKYTISQLNTVTVSSLLKGDKKYA